MKPTLIGPNSECFEEHVEIDVLQDKLEEERETPVDEDVQRLRELLVKHRDIYTLGAYDHIRAQFASCICKGSMQAHMLAEMDLMKKELNYENSERLEKMLIEQVITSWMWLASAQSVMLRATEEKKLFRKGPVLYKYVKSAQDRFLKAVETLAKVRKLASKDPALRINVASNGGKLVNVEGNFCGN